MVFAAMSARASLCFGACQLSRMKHESMMENHSLRMLPTHDDVDIIRCLPHSDCGKRAQKEAVLYVYL